MNNNTTQRPSIKSKRSLRLFFTGFIMGAVDLVPGVSGGTVAFIAGIYEELLYSVKVASGKALKLFLQGKVIDAIKSLPLYFLIPLFAGLFLAIFSLANLLSFLLATYRVYIYALFFGLVIPSTWIVLKRIVVWDMIDKVSFVIAAIGAFFLIGSVPVTTPDTLPMMFISGMLAICAWIMPGISGSFILLLLGKYDQILAATKNFEIMTLSVFMTGALTGITLFSRVLSWLFTKHHDISIAILAGFMLGSVRKIWPWKQVLATRINSHGEEVPFIESNILPASFDTQTMIAISLMIIGTTTVLYLDKVKLTKERTEDVDSKEFKKEHTKALQHES